ncbi:ead/Ea22-like family protein [Pseudomonas sp.]|uniref:ead/Ea22-like family protein n=1 Tax=Pseudomonas sp. TaxID=306 RepID=UPI003C732D60
MTIDKAKLKALAEAATQGERMAEKCVAGIPHVITDEWDIAEVHVTVDANPMADAEFIAASGPAVVLALLAEIERLERDQKNDLIAYRAAIERQEELRADRKACWEEFKVQGRKLDQLKAEDEALRSAAMAAREFIMHEAEVRGLLDESGQVSHHHPRRQAAIASIDKALSKAASHG